MSTLRKTTSPSGIFGRSTSRTMKLAKDLSISLKPTTSRANDGPIPQQRTLRTWVHDKPVTVHETGVTASASKEIQYWTMRAHSAEVQLQLAQHEYISENVARKQDNERIARLEWLVSSLPY
ncbi:hypothetical protein C0995_012621 [Termitomyces sp. Mi166|nr:hypothetical protein C0995_012621 [Termitomyces sp. Mi166\